MTIKHSFTFILINLISLYSYAQITELELQADDNIDLQLKFISNDLLQSNEIGTLKNGDLIFRTDGDFGETMRILDDNGFMGIGKTDPLSKLDILGSMTLSASDSVLQSAKNQVTRFSKESKSGTNGGAQNGTSLQFNGPNGIKSSLNYDGLDLSLYNSQPNSSGGWITIRANGGPKAEVRLQAHNALRFNTGSSLSQQMIINDLGHVGIGTSSPTAELDVAGGIKLGDTAFKQDGTIRYNGINIQAHLDGVWKDILVGDLPLTDCNKFTVQSPAPNQPFSQDFMINANKQVVINIRFNRPVNPSTVVNGSTLIIESDDTFVDGTISWNGSHTIATFISTSSYTDICSFHPDCWINLQLIGNNEGEGAIEDKNGCTLDGDGDGVQGGNFTTTFGILG